MSYVDTTRLRDLLRMRYRPKEWAFIEEVRNTTGFSRTERYADGLAMNLYPSRGLDVIGFEIKSSKSDWKRELALPDKSAPIQKFCDHWYIVASPGIVDKNDLPSAWGLMEPTDDWAELKIKVTAPKLEAVPLDRSFIAAIMRNVSESYENRLRYEAQSGEQYKKGYEQGKLDTERIIGHQNKGYENAFNGLKTAIDEFEKRSGLSINKWDAGNLGEAVKVVQKLGLMHDDLPNMVIRRLKQAQMPLVDLIYALEKLEVFFAEGLKVDVAETPSENEEDDSC